MRMGVALALVLACPSMAAAQYAFQLRPSPYLILGGWEQSANTGDQVMSQAANHVTRAATPVSDRAGSVGIRQIGSRVTGDANHGPSAGR